MMVVAFSGCESTVIPETPQTKLVGKWEMKTSTVASTINGVTTNTAGTFTANDYYEFKADGTIKIMDTGTAYTGTWTVNNSNKLIINGTGNYLNSFASGFDLPILNANNLQLSYVSNLNGIVTVFTLNLTK